MHFSEPIHKKLNINRFYEVKYVMVFLHTIVLDPYIRNPYG